MKAIFRKLPRLLPALAACLMLCGCAQPPQTTAGLLEHAQDACAKLHSYSTAYQMELGVQTESGGTETTVTQVYTDLDLDAGTTVSSVITTASGEGGSSVEAILSYYIPEEDGVYRRYFSYDQENWYVQTLTQDEAADESFAYLAQLPHDAAFTKTQYDGKDVYALTVSGSLETLAPLFPGMNEADALTQMQALDAEFTCMLDAKTFLPRRCALTCTDPDGSFAESLGYAGGTLESFTMELVYDGYDKVDAAQVPETVRSGAQELGEYTSEPLTVDDEGRAVLHASPAADSAAVLIGTPQYFTLDEGLSNFCNACYSVITDAGTVTLQFTLEQADTASRMDAITAELDDAMAGYAEEDAYSELTRLTEPQTLTIQGRDIGSDWLTYLYSYASDSGGSGQTALNAAEYNFWTELEGGLLLRCYACALVSDAEVGCPTPDVLAALIFSDISPA